VKRRAFLIRHALLPARGRLTAHHPHALARRGLFWRRFPYGMGPRFASTRLDLRVASAGSRQGSLVTPGGAPMQPESAADEAARAGAAPRSINRRHRLTPLMSEVGRAYAFIPIMSRGEYAVVPAKAATHNHRSGRGVPASAGTIGGEVRSPHEARRNAGQTFASSGLRPAQASARIRISTYAHAC
jgi:hypothetical protein